MNILTSKVTPLLRNSQNKGSLFVTFFSTKDETAVTKKKSKGKATENTMADNMMKFMDAVKESSKIKVKFSPEESEEHKKIALEYQRQCTIRHNKIQKDLTDKIWMQQEALRALPQNLRAAAEVIDHTAPPKDRPYPIFRTPPIKGFDPRQYGQSNKDDDDDEAI